MTPIEKLTEYFREFPGIGPRQAKRFVYFLLRKDDQYINELVKTIPDLKKSVQQCSSCFRYFSKSNVPNPQCGTCRSIRDRSKLLVVARDVDYEAVEKSGEYDGYYFILGGQISVLEKNPSRFIRIEDLKKNISERKENGLEEVILAMSANPDGDTTAEYIRKKLEPLGVSISTLGRGLSTGTELEYSDKDTISNALRNRH